MHRNNPIIHSWRVKAGSNLLSGTATLPVEKVFLAEVTPASPKDNDIALVKLQSPLRVSGETWHTPPWSESPKRLLMAPRSGLAERCPVWRCSVGTEQRCGEGHV